MNPRASSCSIPLALGLAVLMWAIPASTQSAPDNQNVFPTPALHELWQAETAFAAKSVAEGMSPAFLEYFAPDGVNFTPHPGNTRESLQARPAPPARPPITLDWWPVFGDVSRAGDLGYSTGPYQLTDSRENNKVVGTGNYFSVWKRQADGSWRVAVDYGIESPAAGVGKEAAKFQPSRWVGTQPKNSPTATQDAVLARDRDFAAASLRSGTIAAYREFTSWDNETRLLRDQMNPMIGRQQILNGIGNPSEKVTWQPLAAGVAKSGDLAYTYGKWEPADPAASAAGASGYYLRVWRPVRGDWRVVAEVLNPLPAK